MLVYFPLQSSLFRCLFLLLNFKEVYWVIRSLFADRFEGTILRTCCCISEGCVAELMEFMRAQGQI